MLKSFALGGVLCLSAVCASSTYAAAARLTKLQPEYLEYQVYTGGATKRVVLDDLELWRDMPSDASPEGYFWAEEPDFKYYLLRQGLARVKDRSTATPTWITAEDAAKAAGLGMWRSAAVPPATGSSTATTTTGVTTTPSETSGTVATNTMATDTVATDTVSAKPPTSPLAGWTPTLRQFVVAVVTFFGGWQLLVLIWAYFHRHRLHLVLLGEPNTGKSWLWHRLTDPTISDADLRKLIKSDAVARLRHARLPMGKYEVVPIYTDVPGNQAGEQLSQLIDRKWFRFLQRLLFPQRRIWLILLAPTTDAAKAIGSIADVDPLDLQRQLGALKLYVGVLASRKTPKPDFVAICIAKADYFMANAPDDTTSFKTRDALIHLFGEHISLIETACKEQEIRHSVIVCSALKGWGSGRILDALKRACYTNR